MRALLQRVSRCSVTIDKKLHSSIEHGLLILLGVKEGDTESDALYLAERCSNARIFSDSQDKMNLSVKETGGSVMVVSQFTLYADTRKGNRPSYTSAATPELAERLYGKFVDALKAQVDDDHIRTGVFRASMQIELVNDGPVTIQIESKSTLQHE